MKGEVSGCPIVTEDGRVVVEYEGNIVKLVFRSDFTDQVKADLLGFMAFREECEIRGDVLGHYKGEITTLLVKEVSEVEMFGGGHGKAYYALDLGGRKDRAERRAEKQGLVDKVLESLPTAPSSADKDAALAWMRSFSGCQDLSCERAKRTFGDFNPISKYHNRFWAELELDMERAALANALIKEGE